MKRTVKLAATAIAATCALALSACGGATPSAGSASAWILTGGTNEGIWAGSFETWNKAHSDQKINVERFANDPYKEKIRTSIGSNSAPTLIMNWGGATLADYAKANSVIDLTGKVDEVDARIIPSLTEAGKVNGKTYGVANIGVQPVFLFYNKELFEKAKVEPPKTYDEFLKAVEVFKDQGVTPVALAGQSRWTSMMWLEYLFDRVGGDELFTKIMSGDTEAWKSPDAIKALTMAQDLAKNGAFGESFGSISADSGADVALVYTGKAAMILQGSWTYGSFMTDAEEFVKDGKLGYIEFPTVAGGKGDASALVGNPSNYWAVASSAKPEAQKAAIGYLNSLFDDNYVKELVKGGAIPPTKGAEKFIKGSEQEDWLTFSYGQVVAASSFQMSWDQALPSNTAQTLLENIQKLFSSEITPQQFADSMAAAKE